MITPPSFPNYPTLEDLLRDHASPEEIARDFDYAMLALVLMLQGAPGRIIPTINSYESLWETRNLILSKIERK